MNPINHVAIIMDGNGRWGLRKKNSRNMGHKEGLNTVEKIIRETIKKNIRFLTLYAFSTENWQRPKKEVNFLFNLLKTKDISEDDEKKFERIVQTFTDNHIKIVDEKVASKEKEIMTI